MLLSLNLDLNIQVFGPGNTLLSCPILSLSLNERKMKKSVDFTHLADLSLHTGLSSKHGLVQVFTLLILSCNITHRSFSRQGLVPFVLLNLKW